MMKELFNVPDGWYQLDLQPKKQYTKTRYKYYFDCVMRELLEKAGRFYQLVDPVSGDIRHPRNAEEFHYCMKAIYNPIVLIGPDGKARVTSGTSTDLNDSEFINEFQAQIIADHARPPFCVDITSIEDWRESHRT